MRSLLVIVLLTVLVLGVSFAVKNIYGLGLFGSQEPQESDAIAGVVPVDGDDITEDNTSFAEKTALFEVAIMGDCENDFDSLELALSRAEELNVNAVFFLGDFTSWGDEKSLTEARDIMDASGMTYYAIPGDRDLAASVESGDKSGLKYFKGIFRDNFHEVVINSTRFVVLDNSPNATTLSADLVGSFNNSLSYSSFVLLSQPLYHPSFPRVMGLIDGVENVPVAGQRDELLSSIRDSDVKAVLSGDLHHYSKFVDPVNKELKHYTIGALTSERNLIGREFVVLKVFEDGLYTVDVIKLE